MALVLAFPLVLGGCGKSEHLPYGPGPAATNPFVAAKVGEEASFEILTWNIENFAKSGSVTVDYVAQAVEALDPDVIALQEISSVSYFMNLVDSLDGWSGFRASSDRYINLAYLYKDAAIDLAGRGIYEINAGDWYVFPRTPLVMECLFGDTHLVIINNHLKASGGTENETRRRAGCDSLDAYIKNHYTDSRVILLGDLNDLLTDGEAYNVFQVFLDAPDEYRFVDLDIARGNNIYWSFPGWPSHLDHILISNELFADFEREGSEVRTLRLDTYLLPYGWQTYDADISDHRPVYMKLVF